MVDSISSQISPGSLAEAAGGKALGQEAFLKLLVAQLQNQDPLNPQENYEFVAQLAQFSSLEQTIGINDRLDQLSLQNQGLANSQVVGMVGKKATIKGNIVTLDGQGASVPITFTLAAAAESSQVEIRNPQGVLVRRIEIGARAAGTVTSLWNGQNGNGTPQPAGAYQVNVVAKNATGQPVSVSQQSTGTIEAVSFERGFPVLRLDSGIAAPVADLIEVSPSPSSNP